MLIAVFIVNLLILFALLLMLLGFLAESKDRKALKALKAEIADRPTYSQGFRDGEEEALKSHQKVLDAYRRLFPNAK